MKTYRVTDGLRLVRYGNRLRTEVDDAEIDDLGGSAVAQVVDFLIDVLDGTAGRGDAVEVSSGDLALEFEAFLSREDLGLVEVSIRSTDDDRLVSSTTLVERHEVRLLLEILTGMLAKLCEEGAV